MSSAYAIAGVTAVMQGIIERGVVAHGVGTAIGDDIVVSAVSPDRVNGGEPGLNLFFYQATPNTGWRNEGLPSRNARAERMTNQPLALDLHYLISANGTSDLYSEILLGSAMQTLHETPFFGRNDVRSLLSPPPLPDVDEILNALDASGLADQLEQIKITPEYLSNEDMSKLWSAVQSNYRPSAAYVATLVLIKAEQPARSPLPVLTRGIAVRPDLIPPTPTILTIEYVDQQNVARLGEEVVINGFHLNGSNVRAQLLMQSEALIADFSISGDATNQRIAFNMPVDTTTWLSGIYQLSLIMDDEDGNAIESNRVPLIISPQFSGFNAARNVDDSVTVDLTVSPEVHDNQTVSLILGQTQQFGEDFDGQTGNLSFVFPVLPAGDYWVRIRVDGIDNILINRGVTPPEFHPDQEVAVL
jgi:hypothetical protein